MICSIVYPKYIYNNNNIYCFFECEEHVELFFDFINAQHAGPAKWFLMRGGGGGGQIVSFLNNVGHHGLLCPRRPYIELFCVEQNVKIIINNTWNIPFFTFIEQKLSTNFS